MTSRSSASLSPRSPGRAAALLLSFVLARASSADDKPRVVVLDLQGEGAPALRAQLADALAGTCDVRGQGEWNRAAARLGVAPASSKSAVARIAKELRAQAVVAAEVARRGNKLSLLVVVRNGKTGVSLDSGRWPAGGHARAGLAPAQARQLSRFLARTAAKGRAGEPTLPPEPLPEGSTSANATRTRSAPAEPGATIPPMPMVDAAVGLTLVARSFQYGDHRDRLRDYDSSLVPGFALGLEAYPLQLVTRGLAANFGVALSYGQVFTLTSKVDDGSSDDAMATTLSESEIGVRLRHRFSSGWIAKAIVGYGRIAFHIDWGSREPELLDATHDFARVGGALDVPLSEKLRASASIAYLAVLGSGALGGAGGGGFDLSAGADWRLTPQLSAGPRVRLTRLAIADPATADDGVEPNSATDQYVGGSLTTTYAF